MVAVVFCVLFALAVTPISASWHPLQPSDVGGGVDCVGCTLAVSLFSQLAVKYNTTVDKYIDDVCKLFPIKFDTICEYYVNLYGADVIKLLSQGFTADEVCNAIEFCSMPTCRLWAPSGKELPKKEPTKKAAPQWSPWDWLLELLEPIIKYSEPILDFDNDTYSVEPELRGSNWRGKDCEDFDGDQYPGRSFTTYPPFIDHNCNGIYEKDGIDYEKLYCSGSGQLGTVVVGDSAGAHFSIPPNWLNATAIDGNTYSNLLEVLSNELDFPHRSATTGFVPSTAEYTVHSLYLNMRNRNRCNHRDYQNICKNGLRSGPAIDMAKTVKRSHLDQPVILVLELIGNDVCTGHPDFNHYTPPPEFKSNIMTILTNLDSVLPPGSHVLMMGLAQGGVLWDLLHDRIHPIGTTYAAVYDYLNCLQVSPCWTWMNSNATVRQKGDDWAKTLSMQYQIIVNTTKFKNFDMAYYDFPLPEIFKMWKAQGGELWQLIEPSDGFHPNQISNYLSADWTWKTLLKDHPDWLGPVNPHNADIDRIFGDQGGY
eukprot:TRINITY_DN2423_c0_g1_i1.p1 TRINITY_DN2423_c0_g1~~TRINITY_DN2423_c0_g1_i1.p1  ORF type:complete len:538 (-),score=124.40 TRINITY_DN2423_c0_g1_i1:159-1772(-)